MLLQLPGQGNQCLILRIGERLVVRAFKFDAQRKVIARLTPFKAGNTRMPGAVQARHKLRDLAVAFNQKMRADA